MTPAVYNLTVYEGADFHLSLVLKEDDGTPIDLTDYQCRMKIRNKIDSPTAIDFAPYITVGTTSGNIAIEMAASATIDWGYTTGVYDIEIESPAGAIDKVLRGNVTIIEEVTY